MLYILSVYTLQLSYHIYVVKTKMETNISTENGFGGRRGGFQYIEVCPIILHRIDLNSLGLAYQRAQFFVLGINGATLSPK